MNLMYIHLLIQLQKGDLFKNYIEFAFDALIHLFKNYTEFAPNTDFQTVGYRYRS